MSNLKKTISAYQEKLNEMELLNLKLIETINKFDKELDKLIEILKNQK